MKSETTTIKKRRIRKDTPSYILRKLIAVKGKLLVDVGTKLGITYPTVRALINEPKKFDGNQRDQLSKLLGVPVDVIDDIINGRYANVDGVISGTYADAYKYKGYETK